jgi:hypothetical protein
MNNPNPHFFLKKLTLLSILIILFLNSSFSQSVKINQNTKEKTISFGNEKINVTLDYNKKANISLVIVNGQSVIQN